MEHKNKRIAKASDTQKLFLVDYLEKRPDLASDKVTSIKGAHSRDEEWETLSVKLNNLRGTVKDGPKWRKYWKDLMLSVRHRQSAINEQSLKKGIHGYLPLKQLSEIDKRILRILNLESIHEVSSLANNIGFETIVIEKTEDIYCEPEEVVDQSLYIGSLIPGEFEDEASMPSLTEEISAPSTTSKTKKRRRIHSSSTDDLLTVLKEIEMKKLRLEERKIELMEPNNIIQNEIKTKLDQLILALNKK